VVPGIYVLLTYCLFPQVIVVEGLHGMNALNRSKELLTGFRGRLVGMYLLIGIINAGLTLAVGQLEHVIPSVTTLRSETGGAHVQLNMVNYVVNILVGQLVGVLLQTYLSICMTLLYFDLRARKEGYDLELAAQKDAVAAPIT
jgi:hypothetical protein